VSLFVGAHAAFRAAPCRVPRAYFGEAPPPIDIAPELEPALVAGGGSCFQLLLQLLLLLVGCGCAVADGGEYPSGAVASDGRRHPLAVRRRAAISATARPGIDRLHRDVRRHRIICAEQNGFATVVIEVGAPSHDHAQTNDGRGGAHRQHFN